MTAGASRAAPDLGGAFDHFRTAKCPEASTTRRLRMTSPEAPSGGREGAARLAPGKGRHIGKGGN